MSRVARIFYKLKLILTMTLLIVCNGFSSLIVDGKKCFPFFPFASLKFSSLKTLEILDEWRIQLFFSFFLLSFGALKAVNTFLLLFCFWLLELLLLGRRQKNSSLELSKE